jgi:citrate synthase
MAEMTKKGLEDVIAGTTAICFIDGREGRLIYRGYDIHDLVQGSFEEAAYLLLVGKLPTTGELEKFRSQLQAESVLSQSTLDHVKELPKGANLMEALRNMVGALSLADAEANDNSHEANLRKAVRLIAKTSLMVPAMHRAQKGEAYIEPKQGRSIAWNFLWMMFGTEPNPDHVKMIDTALILHADHEFNASTFTARVIAATLSDMYSAAVGAIGALKGPLHGGANEQVMRMLLEINDASKSEAWIREALASKKKIMGFGHRVYKTEDPRATHLRRMSEQLGKETGETKWYEMSRTIEGVVLEEKGLYPNVDFYSASTYYMMGIPLELYTPIFAMSRMAGWTAHVIEQHLDNRLIRPAGDYIGETNLEYVPIDQRA